MAYKRKIFKRRRFVKSKKSYRRGYGSKGTSYTSQSGRTGSVFFKKKRFNKRVYKRRLWNSTVDKQHYRSSGGLVQAVSSPGSAQSKHWERLGSIYNGTTGQFWTTNGGAVSHVSGGTVPTFDGDIVIRGGEIGVNILNVGDVSVTVEVYLMFSVSNPTFVTIGNGSGDSNIGFEPTMIPEFRQTNGKVLMKKEFLLQPDQTGIVTRKLFVQKVDKDNFIAGASQYQWLVNCRNLQNDSVAVVNVARMYNLTFTGDAQ